MFQIDDPTAVTVMPTPEAAGTQGWFTEGNPATSTPATNVRASFLNGLTKELMNLLAEMGATPSKTSYTQVRDAIYGMIAAKSPASVASSGWQKLPSGLIVQWGVGTAGQGGAVVVNTFPLAWPTAPRVVAAIHIGTDASVNVIIDATTPPSTTQFGMRSNFASSSVSVHYIAIGN